MTNEEILRGLNPAQRAAVEAYNEPSLIIAGAGSGKTRVLTTRIAYMLAQGVAPHSIMALTFTNKAAKEMRERIEKMVGSASRYICMGTFHSVFSRILRENAEVLGYPKEYTIYEPNDSKNLLRTIIKERGLSDDKYKPNVIASRISVAKNNLITPGAYLQNSIFATEDRKAQMPEFGNLYAEYCRRCKMNGAMDFDDLLLQTNFLFRDHPEVLAKYQERFQYVLVDEYQDTNNAQYIIVRRLAQYHSRICVVGDDAQSIYSFRGAKIENILSFQRDYPQAKVFKLEQNYRSTQTIVDAANSIINHNSRQLKKKCFSEGASGEKIRIFKAYTDREEADLVVGDLRDRVREGSGKWSDAAILYRTNNQSQALENSLRQRGIPYLIYKGSSFYDHKEVKDILSYIRLIINPRDDEAFKRIINTPARGIGDTTVARIEAMAKEKQVSMWEAVDTLVEQTPADSVEKAIVKKVTEFVALIRSLSLEREHKGLYDFGMEVAVRSGLLPFYREQNTPEAQSAVANLEDYLLTGKLFCGNCGKPMVGICGTSRTGERHYYYLCQGKHNKLGCDKKNERKEKIEQAVINAVKELILDDQTIDWIIDGYQQFMEQARGESAVTAMEKELADTEKGIDNLMRAIEMGIITDTTKARMMELEDKKKELEARIRIESRLLMELDPDQLRFSIERFRDKNINNKKYQKELINTFVKAVYVFDDHLKLVLNRGPGDEQEIPFEEMSAVGVEETGASCVRINADKAYQSVPVRTRITIQDYGIVVVVSY